MDKIPLDFYKAWEVAQNLQDGEDLIIQKRKNKIKMFIKPVFKTYELDFKKNDII